MAENKGLWALLVLFIALIFLSLYSYVGITGKVVSINDADIVKIGFVAPLAEEAPIGQSIKRGVDLALQESNLKNVKVTYADSKCNSNEAVYATNKLINEDKVIAIIEGVCNDAMFSMTPIIEQNKVAMISASSVSPAVIRAGDYVFVISSTNPDIISTSFKSKYRVRYNLEPDQFAAQAYDAFTALALSIKDGAQTGEEIKNKLYNIKFNGASGRVEFNSNGNVS